MKSMSAIAVPILAVAFVAGCAPTAEPEVQVVTTPGPTVTVTAAPADVAENPEDPITPLVAWTMCAAVAQDAVRDYPGSAFVPLGPTDLAENVSTDETGLVNVVIFLTPPPDAEGFLAVLCHVSGTLGTPFFETTIKTH